ncbi:ABC transporter ATP-binding protein [Metapseudomonas resinovorans]|uniref:Putative ABC transporter ATP-binding protein n=1 Tax=Metapseudomonas resinovorans NBRC 106553 TaxID=1245471 RepID=S6AW42_METRE|nr:ABC transporter ATP-binding protein [Pseudomonas resinovorans]BAN48751.1 putative ABC transporter ATP-binding protein [Pseudomonas resinovorans NBRC 106553]
MTAIPKLAPAIAEQTLPGSLEIRGLSKSYQIEGRQLPVLQNVDLRVNPGEFVSIVGASGCGKSTLLRLIVGLEAEYQGDILLDGERIVATSLERGIVFQDHRLFPWMTVQQNIGLALKNHRLSKAEKARQVAEHIALVNLTGFENAYPHQLSGGMAQRAAIARALITKPKILLLDEPLGALDALTRVHLQRELQRIWVQQRSTMIMVTHDVEEALYLGDRVIVMDSHPGRIKHEVKVDLPHPRDRAAPLLHRLKEELLAELTGH